MECVKRLAAAGYSVRATTRGESSLEKLGVSGGDVQLMAGIDVTKPEVLAPLPRAFRVSPPLEYHEKQRRPLHEFHSNSSPRRVTHPSVPNARTERRPWARRWLERVQ